MKKAKKLAGVLLALIMVFALSATAFAAGSETNDYTYEYEDATPGLTYNLYKVLDLEGVKDDGTAYYTPTDSWYNFFYISIGSYRTLNPNVKSYVKEETLNGKTYLVFTETFTESDFAAAALKYANQWYTNISPDGSVAATDTTVTFENLTLGYYVMNTNSSSGFPITVNVQDVDKEEKKELPVNEKEVEEDSTGDYGSENDADIGQVVNFQSTITTQPETKNYVFHDTMSDGLTFDPDSVSVTVNDTVILNYTVDTTPEDGHTFDITFNFTDAFYEKMGANSKIVISYSATVNENAVVGDEGNENTSYLDYDNDEGATETTVPSTTTTYTWDVDVFKYELDEDEEQVGLAGATFTLSTDSEGTNLIKLVALENNIYRVATEDDEEVTVTEITTDSTGKFTIQGLDADTYYLTETAAPSGYNMLTAPIEIVIDSDGNVSVVDEYGEPIVVDTVEIENKSGSTIPSTGGIGTTIFYAAGTVLVLGAAVLLIVKKRMSVEK